MNPISPQDVSALADAVRRRHRACGAGAATLAALEDHMYRVTMLVEDLSEGESLNTLEYSLLRTAAILHDAAAAKTRPAASPDASAALAAEMLDAVGADGDFSGAVATAIRRHGGTRLGADAAEPETHAEQLLHDVCLLARIAESVATNEDELRETASALYTPTAVRMAGEMIDARAGTSIDA
ncbi:MAG TPA: HD domain-containing protein [Actinomycetota bacterium]